MLAERGQRNHALGSQPGAALNRPFAALALTATMLTPSIAQAADSLASSSALSLALVSGLGLGLGLFAVVAGLGAMKMRQKLRRLEERGTRERLALLAEADHARALLGVEPNVVLVWSYGDEPEIFGDMDFAARLSGGAPLHAFAAWLKSEDLRQMMDGLAHLQLQGAPFSLGAVTKNGEEIEIIGAPVGGKAVLRLRAISGLRQEMAALRRRELSAENRASALTRLAEQSPLPMWQRDADFEIVWANEAFRTALGEGEGELLDREDRERVTKALAAAETFSAQLTATAQGARRLFNVMEVPAAEGSAALAIDVTEAEGLRARLKAEMETHTRTLDQLATAIAIFDSSQKLVFHNSAYRRLWGLDHLFLDSHPSENAVLEKLREMRKLPEQADFREWKRQLQDIYRAPKLEPRESQWFLPDGRSLRVVQNPDENGGVTYVFDDLTENLALQSQFKALNHVQSETLDHLKEAVAVFSSSGTLSLANPALSELLDLPQSFSQDKPHIDQLISHCTPRTEDVAVWYRLKAVVAGLRDKREPFAERMVRKDARIIDCAAVPMPDGGTLVTFRNVTADVALQKSLADHNRALEATNKIKTDFVKNVSYQLRTPLTTIIGFAQVLGDTGVGELNARQQEYLGYITSSSAALLAIINDILDLATVDAGVMELHLTEVDVIECMKAAAEGVRSRLIEGHIGLEIRTHRAIGSFIADEARLRQILFNLLSNAITHSRAGDKVQLEAERRQGQIVFRVRDHGSGMSETVKERAFERFVTEQSGDKFRGVGLGLSLVRAFVDLHKGKVNLQSKPNEGTTVVVTLPASAEGLAVAE